MSAVVCKRSVVFCKPLRRAVCVLVAYLALSALFFAAAANPTMAPLVSRVYEARALWIFGPTVLAGGLAEFPLAYVVGTVAFFGFAVPAMIFWRSSRLLSICLWVCSAAMWIMAGVFPYATN